MERFGDFAPGKAKTMATDTEKFHYAAFISYSRRDEKFAKWLHRKLEALRLPATRPEKNDQSKWPIRPVFRDAEELAASSNLSDSIYTALEQSRALVVVCSPNAAASNWVNREVEHFLTFGRADQIFFVLTSGDPLVYDELHTNGGFPPAIRTLPSEPLWIDARPSGETKERVFARVAAGLIGVSFDAIWQRRRRQKRIALTAWAAVTAIIGPPVLFALIELTKPINLRDCPVDLVIFDSVWGPGRFTVDRVGTNQFYTCQEKRITSNQYAALQNKEQMENCEGPYGSIFFKGKFKEDEGAYERYMIYTNIDGSPCCSWNSPDDISYYHNNNDQKIRWYDTKSAPKLETLQNPLIHFDELSDIGKKDHFINSTLAPTICDLSVGRKASLLFSSWISK